MELELFKITVLPLRAKILGYAQKLMDDVSDAEDVVQEIMIKLWNMRLELEKYNSPEALAMKMTYNLCVDMWRRKKHDARLADERNDPGDPAPTPHHLLEQKDEMALMRAIIDSLPPLQQTIIRMKDIEEYETWEIAEITGCNNEAIRSNLSRARKKVRDLYLLAVRENKRRNMI